MLQFDVVAHRLLHEYKVDWIYESANVACARWVYAPDDKTMSEFRDKTLDYLALDGSDSLIYLAPTRVNLSLAQERYPKIAFLATREH